MGAVGDDFYAAVLANVGAPATPNTLQVCRDWQRFEGGDAAWNPWNTTQPVQPYTEYNSAGVKNYGDQHTGEVATADTLSNGYYPDVLTAFRADLPENEWGLSAQIVAQINTWGTHGFAAYLQSIATAPPAPPSSNWEELPMFLCSRASDNTVFAVFPSGLTVQVAGPQDLAALQSAYNVTHIYPVSDQFIANLGAAQWGHVGATQAEGN